jgi:hypothetical protein
VASEWIKALYCQWPKPLELWYIQEIIGLKWSFSGCCWGLDQAFLWKTFSW